MAACAQKKQCSAEWCACRCLCQSKQRARERERGLIHTPPQKKNGGHSNSAYPALFEVVDINDGELNCVHQAVTNTIASGRTV